MAGAPSHGIDPAARSRSRRRALQAVYAWQMGGDSMEQVIEQFRHEQDMEVADLEYFENLLRGVAGHVKELDAGLTPHLDREVEQVDPIERAAMRLAAYELKFRPDVPYRVILNEAIEVTKRFGAEHGHTYVNGVLDKLAGEWRAVEKRGGRRRRRAPMEFDLIESIRRRTDTARGDVVLGIGDDAALLRPPPGHELVAAHDVLVEGVHFPVGTAGADLGWKALAVNLSDLAAMGATAAWALLGLTLPQGDRAFVDALADGFARLAAEHRVALVGGDTTRGPLSVAVTALGLVPAGQALRRSGARAGEMVYVTGSLGDAAGGLRCLDRNDALSAALMGAPSGTRERLLSRLNRPQPRLAAGAVLRGQASACIDVSDGLLADLGHIAAASGLAARIDAEAVPCSPPLLELFGDEALRLALAGGDDYELCFTVAPERAAQVAADLARSGSGATRIGRMVAGAGVTVHDGEGRQLATPRHGWDHFDT
jgi:thiamine-monophosphate kinase